MMAGCPAAICMEENAFQVYIYDDVKLSYVSLDFGTTRRASYYFPTMSYFRALVGWRISGKGTYQNI